MAALFAATCFIAAATALGSACSFGSLVSGRSAFCRFHGFRRLVPAGPALASCPSACAAAFTLCHNITPSVFSFRHAFLYLTIILRVMSGKTANNLRGINPAGCEMLVKSVLHTVYFG
jgi:hypothetical protein